MVNAERIYRFESYPDYKRFITVSFPAPCNMGWVFLIKGRGYVKEILYINFKIKNMIKKHLFTILIISALITGLSFLLTYFFEIMGLILFTVAFLVLYVIIFDEVENYLKQNKDE